MAIRNSGPGHDQIAPPLEAGRFSFEELEPGLYQFELRDPNVAACPAEPSSVMVPANGLLDQPVRRAGR